ncbi:hypothetical protein [Mangrovibacillus cuniculi]|uniref:Uncharacterized protein n=1 Tax=Mangrovibacillus cuniculi TaxID=2593652 RepID=A0A7S8HG16_9BACI|nr:hypothetical protein [Mangrovibacillus cuniculi]QPC47121.1 hypothetical protein G8O30_09150 [Mangrovibacillus cuniculi]
MLQDIQLFELVNLLKPMIEVILPFLVSMALPGLIAGSLFGKDAGTIASGAGLFLYASYIS